jgi:hypothetical protein
MALADTGKAIKGVTDLLKTHIEERLKPPQVPENFTVTVGRPGESRSNAGLNLFLYEALFDASLKNVSLAEGQQPPLWLVLKYLLTPFGSTGPNAGSQFDSDTLEALECLGEGVKTLQELNYLEIRTSVADELQDNPEPLKITFNEASADLLSRLMQGSEDKYRFSMAFEVRPVMIATGEPPSHSLLVGIDYTRVPSLELTEEEKGVHIDVIPAMGPVISSVSPGKFEVNEPVTIYGTNLDQAGLSVSLGPLELGAAAQQPEKLQFNVNGTAAGGEVISAGSHPLKVIKTLSYGRIRSSNLLVAHLLPKLDPGPVTPGSLVLEPHPYLTGKEVVTGEVTLTGTLLGTDKDDIIVSFYREGKVTGIIEVSVDPPATPLQTQLKVHILAEHKIPEGVYNLVLLVNGQQARRSPRVELIVP